MRSYRHSLVVLILLFSTSNTVAGDDDSIDDGARKLNIKKYLPGCKIRYDRINLLKHTCEEVYEHQEMCKRPLTVSYSNFPPYVFKDENGKVKGLLPGMFSLKPEN